MVSEVIPWSPEAVSKLNSDQAHADDMTKLGHLASIYQSARKAQDIHQQTQCTNRPSPPS